MASAEASPAGCQTGSFNYLAPSVRHSLYRNGEVLTRRDRDGSDAGTEGVVREKRDMPVHDARRLGGDTRRTLAANGFELLERPFGRGDDLDFLRHEQVVGEYYEDCARIVQQATGAAHVFAFDHNVRSARGKKSRARIEGGQQVQAPAHVVHGDYTLTSAPQRLRDLARPPGVNDTLRPFLPAGRSHPKQSVDRALEQGTRFAIINVWRNIAEEPVATHPLALCDAQSVHPEDLVVFEIHYEDRVGENYFAKHSPRHRWYYYPGITRDEALLIKQWDSAGTLARSRGEQPDSAGDEDPCSFSFHSAFKDPSTPPDAPDRWSIEVRCAVLYD